MTKTSFLHLEISKGLCALKDIAHMDAMGRWKQLSVAQRCAAARALVLLNAAAKNPSRYFSRVRTLGAWQSRAHVFKNRYDIKDDKIAMDSVPTPGEMFVEKVGFVWADKHMEDIFKKFCELVFLWEYEHLSDAKDNLSDKYADAIVCAVDEICARQLQMKNKQNNTLLQKIKTSFCR